MVFLNSKHFPCRNKWQLRKLCNIIIIIFAVVNLHPVEFVLVWSLQFVSFVTNCDNVLEKRMCVIRLRQKERN